MKFCFIRCSSLARAFVVLLLGRKLSCSIWRWSDNGVKIICFITVSNSFATQEVSDLGRYESTSLVSFPALRIGITVALLHSDGNDDSMKDLLNNSVSSSTNVFANFSTSKCEFHQGQLHQAGALRWSI